jgi:hypothetical protein
MVISHSMPEETAPLINVGALCARKEMWGRNGRLDTDAVTLVR